MAYPLENAIFQWQEGQRRFQALDPSLRRRADAALDAVLEELRRRVGSTFTGAELADAYGEGTEWCLQVVTDIAPGLSAEAGALADAAFWRYLRAAADYAGGTRLAV